MLASEKTSIGWNGLFVLWHQKKSLRNLIAIGMLCKIFRNFHLKIFKQTRFEITHKSDISDETSSTFSEFALGRSSTRGSKLPNEAENEVCFQINALWRYKNAYSWKKWTNHKFSNCLIFPTKSYRLKTLQAYGKNGHWRIIPGNKLWNVSA